MSVRLSFIALCFLAYLILLLLNINRVEFRFFMFNLQVPLVYVIVLSTIFGAVITLIFASLGAREKKMRAKIRHFQKKSAPAPGGKTKGPAEKKRR